LQRNRPEQDLHTALDGHHRYPIVSSPAVANGVAYVGSTDGKLYAFDAAGVGGCSGSDADKICQPLGRPPPATRSTTSPAVAAAWCTSGRSTASCMRSTQPA